MVQFGRWHADAEVAGLPEPTAMALATAGTDARPSVRHVLLKGFGHDGFLWFTNYESRKGRELAENPFAALVFPWFGMTPPRQAIVRGAVELLEPADSDEYFGTRPRPSQLAAWASDQGREIPDRALLEARYAELEARFAGSPVPRPPHWGGYRLRPDAFEFWQGQPNRLHDRFEYRPDPHDPTHWRVARLAP